MGIPKAGEVYQHYRGNQYKIICTAKDCETSGRLVIFKELFGNGTIWCKPLCMFNAAVEVDGRSVPRLSVVK